MQVAVSSTNLGDAFDEALRGPTSPAADLRHPTRVMWKSFPRALHPRAVAALQRNADRVALRIVRTCRIPRHEQEDLRQDLLTDLFARLKGFDPARGDLGAFAAACFDHRAIRLIERVLRGRATMAPISLDDPQPGGEGLTIGDSIAEADGYGAWLGQPTDAFAAVERRIDLDRALGTLPAETLPLCAELTERSPHELAKTCAMSRATLYRHLHELRLRLLVAGIPAAA